MSGIGADLDMVATDLMDTSAGYYTYPVYLFRNILNYPNLGFRVVIDTLDTSAGYCTYPGLGFRV